MLIQRAGELRHRIAIESSDGSSGWQVDQWQMADVRPKATGIWFLPSGLTPKESHGVLTRYARCLTQRSRVLIPVEHAKLSAAIDGRFLLGIDVIVDICRFVVTGNVFF